MRFVVHRCELHLPTFCCQIHQHICYNLFSLHGWWRKLGQSSSDQRGGGWWWIIAGGDQATMLTFLPPAFTLVSNLQNANLRVSHENHISVNRYVHVHVYCDDSNMSLLHLEAPKYFLRHASTFLNLRRVLYSPSHVIFHNLIQQIVLLPVW